MTGLQVRGPYSKGYGIENGALKDTSGIDPSAGWASSAMISDLNDLKVWAAALAEGHLVSEEAQQERLRTVPTNVGAISYGLGVMKYGDFIGHEGNAFGYSTAMFYMPSKRATIIVFLNSVPNDRINAVNAFMRFAKVLFPDKTS